VNIALHHFLEKEDIDLVISGPNFGRNSSSTFITSSGTVGAAQEAAFCGKKALALSFAFFREEGYDDEDVNKACLISRDLVQKIYNSWPEGVGLFNINVPVFKGMGSSLEIFQTRIFQNSYASLYSVQVGLHKRESFLF